MSKKGLVGLAAGSAIAFLYLPRILFRPLLRLICFLSILCDVRMRSVAVALTESPRASAFTRQPPWVTVHFHGNSKCLSWLKKPSFWSKTDTFYEKQLRYYFPWELLESNAKIKSCSYQNGNGFLFCDRFWDLAVGLNWTQMGPACSRNHLPLQTWHCSPWS